MESIVCSRRVKVVSLMVLVMLVIGLGRVEAGIFDPGEEKGPCAKKCELKCMTRVNPDRIALCIGICMVGCQLKPTPVVFRCTSGCSRTMFNTYKHAGAQKVEIMVGSCYESCKQSHSGDSA